MTDSAKGVMTTRLVSGPGYGKTAFLEKTVTSLRSCSTAAALARDVAIRN
jgi:Ni2+-binding GTPase involved in maturation of urease and hydrogenase